MNDAVVSLYLSFQYDALYAVSWQVSKLFRELDMLEGQGHFGNRHGKTWKSLNKTALLSQCKVDPAPLECRSHWVLSSEIPDEVASEYLTFSFVRDPFARFLSAHREVGSKRFVFGSYQSMIGGIIIAENV